MAEERDPTEDVTGTSEPATPHEYVDNARADGGARDIVGASSDDARASTDGVYDEEQLADPAFQAVIEGGGGVSEGFEQAEAALVANATDSEGSTRDILFDAIDEGDGDDPENFGEGDSVKEADDD
ncbi:MAG: hypothetical protein Q7T55_21095 [Solirubrobacteraceae bacterium]|nr:hypothetical protein [Solirubrobacteraceae bacterium]